jgi:hypothetical protein
MAWLRRSVNGLSWGLFARAQTGAELLAEVIGVAVAVLAHLSRGDLLGILALLLEACLVAVFVYLAASRLGPRLFLGSHGIWAVGQVEQLLRRGARRKAASGASAEGLAAAGETNAK